MNESPFQYWRFCAWNGVIFMGVFVYFWGYLGHNFPPFQPDVPAAEVARFFRGNANGVRMGMGVAMMFAVSYAVWGIAISKVMEHVLDRDHILVYLQRWGAGLTVVPVLVSSSFWLTASFRPEALPDEILQLLYDMAWLLIDMAWSVTSVQLFALGLGFLKDKRATPLVPAWLNWWAIWVGFMFVAELLMPFFRNGAFARSGLLNFWIEFMIWVLWVPVMSFYLVKAIGRLEAEHQQASRTIQATAPTHQTAAHQAASAR